jgi:hypothetical protein
MNGEVTLIDSFKKKITKKETYLSVRAWLLTGDQLLYLALVFISDRSP